MSEEKRKTSQTNKIVPMPTAMNDQEQDQVDSLILERLDREADALEEELNNDPSLAGVSLSRDFLNVIIGKLKEEGLWEEEDEEMAENEDGEERNGKEKNGVIESNQDRERNGEIEKNIERDRKSKECEEQQESRDGKRSGAEVGDKEEKECEGRARCVEAGDKGGRGKILETIDQEEQSKSVEIEGKEAKENLEERNGLESRNSKEDGVSMTQEDLDRLYQMLPEQDRRAMEMGRQVEKRREKRRRRFRRWGMPIGVAASLMVIVCGVGMSSEANREWIMKTGNSVLESLGFKISTNFMDVESILQSKGIVEQEALKKIKEKMDRLVPCFVNVPDGFEFLDYETASDRSEATMFYSYQNKIVTVKIYKKGDEGVIYTGVEDNAVLRDTFQSVQKSNIKIWEINLDISGESYLAEAEYEDGHYVINAVMPFDEIKKMVKSVFFL